MTQKPPFAQSKSPEDTDNQVMDSLRSFRDEIKTGDADVDYCLDKMNSDPFGEGSHPCEQIVAKIDATLTCLSMSKEVFEQIVDAVSALEKKVSDLLQDIIDSISNTANNIQVLDEIQDFAVNAFKSLTSQIDEGVTDIINAGQNAVDFMANAGSQAVNAVENAGSQAIDSLSIGSLAGLQNAGFAVLMQLI